MPTFLPGLPGGLLGAELCPPQNSHAIILIPRTSEFDLRWRWGLYGKMKSLSGPCPSRTGVFLGRLEHRLAQRKDTLDLRLLSPRTVRKQMSVFQLPSLWYVVVTVLANEQNHPCKLSHHLPSSQLCLPKGRGKSQPPFPRTAEISLFHIFRMKRNPSQAEGGFLHLPARRGWQLIP